MTFDDEQRQLKAVKQDLVREFGGRLSEQEVSERFDQIVAGFAEAPVRTFVPVLASRLLRQQLAAT
jgi:hypothetical protein